MKKQGEEVLNASKIAVAEVLGGAHAGKKSDEDTTMAGAASSNTTLDG